MSECKAKQVPRASVRSLGCSLGPSGEGDDDLLIRQRTQIGNLYA
jgi:hypothetical protein